jgi:hypothetical protein
MHVLVPFFLGVLTGVAAVLLVLRFGNPGLLKRSAGTVKESTDELAADELPRFGKEARPSEPAPAGPGPSIAPEASVAPAPEPAAPLAAAPDSPAPVAAAPAPEPAAVVAEPPPADPTPPPDPMPPHRPLPPRAPDPRAPEHLVSAGGAVPAGDDSDLPVARPAEASPPVAREASGAATTDPDALPFVEAELLPSIEDPDGDPRDKRQHVRLVSSEPLMVTPFAGRETMAEVCDVSLGGVRFRVVGLSVRPGDLMHVTFNLGGESVTAVARVLRTRTLDEITREVAAQFVRLDPWAARRFEEALAEADAPALRRSAEGEAG